MESVCVCGEIHLPYWTRLYWPEENNRGASLERYFDEKGAISNFNRVSEDIVFTNSLIRDSIDSGGKYAFNISGTFIDQCKWNTHVIQSFRELANTGNVEFTAAPYYHSICSLYPNLAEFREQVKKHSETMFELFGSRPKTFVNSELILSNRISEAVSGMGFDCMISEGSRNIIDGGNPAHVYNTHLPTLLRHINLSEDIEKRFSEKSWKAYPLAADEFASWISGMEGDIVTLYFNYPALAEHHKSEERIAHFIRELPYELERHGIRMVTPSEAAKTHRKVKMKELGNDSTARYGMHSMVGDHIQNLYLQQLIAIGQDLENITSSPEYGDLKKIYGYLQQTDIMHDMNPANFKAAYEKAINNYSILSDLRRVILEAGI